MDGDDGKREVVDEADALVKVVVFVIVVLSVDVVVDLEYLTLVDEDDEHRVESEGELLDLYQACC